MNESNNRRNLLLVVAVGVWGLFTATMTNVVANLITPNFQNIDLPTNLDRYETLFLAICGAGGIFFIIANVIALRILNQRDKMLYMILFFVGGLGLITAIQNPQETRYAVERVLDIILPEQDDIDKNELETLTPRPSNTPSSTPTVAPTDTDIPTDTDVPTNEPTVTSTDTDIPTDTDVPTNEPTVTSTDTDISTDEPTNTPIATLVPTDAPIDTRFASGSFIIEFPPMPVEPTWTYLIVTPSSDLNEAEDSYIIRLPNFGVDGFSDKLGFVFSEDKAIYVITPAFNPIQVAVHPILPDSKTGSYYFTTGFTGGGITNNVVGNEAPQIDRVLIEGLDLDQSRSTNAFQIKGNSEALVISPQGDNYSPALEDRNRLNICLRSDIVGVVALDFNAGNASEATNPAFQILQLANDMEEDDPLQSVRFNILTLENDTAFTATANAVGFDGENRLGIQISEIPFFGADDYDLEYRLEDWDSINDNEYEELYNAFNINVGADIYATGAYIGAVHIPNNTLTIPIQRSGCREEIGEDQEVSFLQRDRQGVPAYLPRDIENSTYYLRGDLDPSGNLFQPQQSRATLTGKNVLLTDILDNGWLCYVELEDIRDDGTYLDTVVRCIEAWRVDIAPPVES